MRKIFFVCITAVMTMVACQKEAENLTKQAKSKVSVLDANTSAAPVWVLPRSFEPNSFYKNGGQPAVASLDDASLYCGGITEVTLHAGNVIVGGKIQYANDATNLYVTFFADPDWYFTSVQLYVGKFTATPHAKDGSPSQRRFPFQRAFTYSTLSQSETFTIPLSSLTKSATGEWIIVAAADIVRTQLRGNKYTCEKEAGMMMIMMMMMPQTIMISKSLEDIQYGVQERLFSRQVEDVEIIMFLNKPTL